MSKTISNKLKTVLGFTKILISLISLPQTAYVKNRFVGGSGTLISKITEISEWFNIKGFLVTMIIEKTFDSPDNDFFSSVLIKFGFGKTFYDMSKQKSALVCYKW